MLIVNKKNTTTIASSIRSLITSNFDLVSFSTKTNFRYEIVFTSKLNLEETSKKLEKLFSSLAEDYSQVEFIETSTKNNYFLRIRKLDKK